MPRFEKYQVMIVSEELAKIFANMPEMTRWGGKIKSPGGKLLNPKVVITAESLGWVKDNLRRIVDENCDETHPEIVIILRQWECAECQSSCTHGDKAIAIGRAILTNADKVRQQLS
jgi:hypothetical protein